VRDHEEQAFARCESDEWLREMLSTGPVLHAEILTAGRLNGFTRDTLRRAKERIGAMSCREGFGPGSRLYWDLKRAFDRDRLSRIVGRIPRLWSRKAISLSPPADIDGLRAG
jgi:hypothetical protein